MPRLVVQHYGKAGAHRCHQRIGRAQIDADRQPMLVRRGRHAGFGNLQQSHVLTFEFFVHVADFGDEFVHETQLAHGFGNMVGSP